MKRILVAGASGFVGAHLWPRLAARHRHPVVLASRRSVAPLPDGVVSLTGDLEDERYVEELARSSVDAVVYLAGVTDAGRAEREPERALRANALAPEQLSRAVAATCRRFIFVSTDLVFDGSRGFYREADRPAPASVYGRSKLRGERAVRAILGERAVILRLALLYGARKSPESRQSFSERLIRTAAEGIPVELFADELRTPLYVEDAVDSLLRLVDLERVPPLVHLGGPERVSRYEMGRMALEIFGLGGELARARLVTQTPSPVPRPRDVSLDSTLARSLGLACGGLHSGLGRMKREMEAGGFMVGS